ncbi:hypothetical protein CEXT_273711 [Caerostris extrusa]|uniref:Maturase K n=1 Tax=Caerostris extrusa TaxID=172846 RepID=A0AAV4PHD9_CAEEX|nr:hypothetical protein CEXT_273711 [Caerostris extrusa]
MVFDTRHKSLTKDKIIANEVSRNLLKWLSHPGYLQSKSLMLFRRRIEFSGVILGDRRVGYNNKPLSEMTLLPCFSSCQFHEKQIFISYIVLHFTSPCRHFSKGDFRNELHLYNNGTLISRVFIECTVRMLYEFFGRRVDFLFRSVA